MELNEAQLLIKQLIKEKLKHTDYDAVVELANKLQILITGVNANLLLRRYVTRENDAAFIQRCAVTRTITPAVAASIKVPFYKVARNQRIRSVIDVKDEAKTEQIKDMVKGFYGSSGRKTKGLDYWLKTRFMDLTFTDPNAWVVVEWDAPKTSADVLQTRPFEVSAKQAHNFKIINEECFWLFTCFDIKYYTMDGKNSKLVPGLKYTLYEKTYTITHEQVDPKYLTAQKITTGPNQQLIDAGDGMYWLETVNEPKLGFVPAFRIGYNRDLSTGGRTYVNPFHDGMCYFDKSIKTVSEFDLTMSQHAFPQKIQYAPACKGMDKNNTCKGGYQLDGQVCKKCNGTGFAGHTSSMDVLTLPLPEKNTPNAEVIELTKLIAYVTPSIELINFQNSYIQQLKSEVHQAVFNSQVFVRKSGGGMTAQKSTDGAPIQTATENDNNMQSVYDALEPFTEKFSDVWEDIVTVIALLANVLDIEQVDIDHVFPADFKLKTTDILLSELAVVNESGAPSFMKDAIGSDLAEIIFAGDALGLIKYRTKRKYFPFNGKNPDEIAILLMSPDVPRRSKILYSNYELIFADIENENPQFYTMNNPKGQADILQKKIDEYKTMLDKEKPALDVNSFRSGLPGQQAPAGQGGNNDGNNGNNGDGNQNQPVK